MSSSRLPRRRTPSVKAIAGGSPGLSRTFESLTPLPPTVVRHSSSHSLASLEREFNPLGASGSMSSVLVGGSDLDGGFSGGGEVVVENATGYFRACPSFNQRSSMTARSSAIKRLPQHCCFDLGYVHHLPRRTDKMWCPPREGWQAIPLLFFEYGFRLPMHPFFGVVYEALGCGLAQLSPNAIIQIVGFIARCHEKGELPSLELLFSIYRVKNTNGLLYLDRKAGRVRIVDAPSSNTIWHSQWTYMEGDDLSLVRPWSVIPKWRLKELNQMPSLPEDFLNDFHGETEPYNTDTLSDIKFLTKHCCKNLF